MVRCMQTFGHVVFPVKILIFDIFILEFSTHTQVIIMLIMVGHGFRRPLVVLTRALEVKFESRGSKWFTYNLPLQQRQEVSNLKLYCQEKIVVVQPRRLNLSKPWFCSLCSLHLYTGFCFTSIQVSFSTLLSSVRPCPLFVFSEILLLKVCVAWLASLISFPWSLSALGLFSSVKDSVSSVSAFSHH